MKACFGSTQLLLPEDQDILSNWPVIACDQYTSQAEYWNEVEDIVGENPSALRIVLPEIYLSEKNKRIPGIQEKMEEYMEKDVLKVCVEDGFILVERDTGTGIRLGLVGQVDLDTYDYHPGNDYLIRATEGTIESRIPPRMEIRHNALLESSHIMILMDDPAQTLIERLYEKKDQFKKVYDQELMLEGGYIRGYAIDGEDAKEVNAALYEMQCTSNGLFIAVGDGNHSLATAKACWDKIKESLPEEDKQSHPAKYAMAELVNLHSPSLVFEPIHRIVFDVDSEDMNAKFADYLTENQVEFHYSKAKLIDISEIPNQKLMDYEKQQVIFLDQKFCHLYELNITTGRIPVDYVQCFLDAYLPKDLEKVDYIHGEENLRFIMKDSDVGIILPTMKKEELFPAIMAGGVLPRKTFSMGEAVDKRYYMECRKIK